jgi:GNAT superfamily N-acetyltransferase
VLDEVLDLYRAAGTSGWLIDGGRAGLAAGAVRDGAVGVHVADIAAIEPATVDGLTIRPAEPADTSTWVGVFAAANELEGRFVEAWRRFQPILARVHGYQPIVAELDGRVVAVAATQTHRRVAWLGAAAVLPDARGRGIQRALIAHRAAAAADAGCTRAMATATIGSISAANLGAAGFQHIWTREHLRFDPAGGS